MERWIDAKYKNHSMMILETLMIFDLWLLIKTRWLLTKLYRFMAPILKAVFFMTLGVVIFLSCLLVHGKFDVNQATYKQSQSCKNYGPALNNYLEIDDDSRPAVVTMRKELIRIKSESTKLEKTLHRMSNHLKNLYDRQKNFDANLADFASESVGGLVLDTPDTLPYHNPGSKEMTIFGIAIWKANHFTPRKVIQPWTEPGQCWAFRGSRGKIEIELAHPTIIERVTLEHIPATASLTGTIEDAPKDFNVLGKLDHEYVFIDSFVYETSGVPSQTFAIKKPNTKIAFKRVILEILSNWGHPHYTCVYRFKVHGRMYNSNSPENM